MPRYWWAVVTIGLSIFMATLDLTIVALALPTIAQNFHLTAEAMSSVTLGYTATLTLLLIPAGQISSRFAPQKIFIVGVLGFAASSVLCALSFNLPTLVGSRILQGAFGALLTTLGVALIGAIVPPTARGRAMSISGMLAPLGLVTGPALGGLLLSRFPWPSIFYVNVPVSIIAVLLALWALKGASFGENRRRAGIQQWSTILKLPSFDFALVCLFFMSLVAGSIYFLLPFDLIKVQNLPSDVAGAALLFQPLGLVIIAPLSGYLTDRYGAKPMLLTGISLGVVGMALYTTVLGAPTSVANLDWRFLITGLGFGMFAGPVQALIVSIVPRQALGSTGALIGLARNLGTAIGPVLVSLIWLMITDVAAQMVIGAMAIIGLALIALGFAFLATRKGAQTEEQQPAQAATVQPVQTSSTR